MKKLTLSDAKQSLASLNADFARLIARETYDLNIYSPKLADPQTPHLRDELYVVAAGEGDFVCDGETERFAPGDLFFVPAGIVHRFENFTPEFAAWVVFFGPRPS